MGWFKTVLNHKTTAGLIIDLAHLPSVLLLWQYASLNFGDWNFKHIKLFSYVCKTMINWGNTVCYYSERSSCSNLMLRSSCGLHAVVSSYYYYYIEDHNQLFVTSTTHDPRPTHLAYYTQVRTIFDKQWLHKLGINRKKLRKMLESGRVYKTDVSNWKKWVMISACLKAVLQKL